MGTNENRARYDRRKLHHPGDLTDEEWDGTLERIHHALYVTYRELANRDASPTVGKKRHVLVDTQGLLIAAIVHTAGVQDRDGGVLLMSALFGAFRFLLRLYADSGYQGPTFQAGLRRSAIG